ncbi:flavin reductase family protein [Puteibacter caeruleilacunae]|nr:flavin reductase family protein [Puteibacter caeruleilacunae]
MNTSSDTLVQEADQEVIDYSDIPKKNIGNHSPLYPTPTTVVGTKVNDKINWIAIAHIGNIGFDCLLLSMHKSHHSNQGIKKNQTLSVNMVTESMMIPADYVGMNSGKDVDKSEVFEYFEGTLQNAPMIKASPIAMECEVIDIYDTEHHDNFVVKIINTYVSETILDERERIDFNKVKPLLFEMPGRSYYKVGKRVGNAWKDGEKFKN